MPDDFSAVTEGIFPPLMLIVFVQIIPFFRRRIKSFGSSSCLQSKYSTFFPPLSSVWFVIFRKSKFFAAIFIIFSPPRQDEWVFPVPPIFFRIPFRYFPRDSRFYANRNPRLKFQNPPQRILPAKNRRNPYRRFSEWFCRRVWVIFFIFPENSDA